MQYGVGDTLQQCPVVVARQAIKGRVGGREFQQCAPADRQEGSLTCKGVIQNVCVSEEGIPHSSCLPMCSTDLTGSQTIP